MWGSKPQGKAFKRTETRKGEPGLQPVISKLAEGGAAHTPASPADLHREGEREPRGGGRTSLMKVPEAPLGKGQWGQVLNTASVTGGGTDSGTSVRERKTTDPENHTALLFNGTPPFNAVLNHTPKSPEKRLLINQ